MEYAAVPDGGVGSTAFPIEGALLAHHPPPTGIYERRREIARVLSDVDKGEFSALWSPRFAGRTTFLRSLEAQLNRRERDKALYISPSSHLDASSRGSLFQSFASYLHLMLSPVGGDTSLIQEYDWNGPDVLREFLVDFLDELSLGRVTLLLDDCDQLLSTSLVMLLRSLREIYRAREETKYSVLRRLGIVVAGAVSFRNFKLLEQDELSPFDDWSVNHLHDLTSEEANAYLGAAFTNIGVRCDPTAIDCMIDYAGGDLLHLNALGRHVTSSEDRSISEQEVVRIAKRLVRDYQSDASWMYMLSVISHDPRCLEVVGSLRDGEAPFERSHLNRYQDQYFGISNQELSGAFILLREEGRPVKWRIRNRMCRDVLDSHFSAQRLVRVFLDLARYDKVALHIDRLTKELASDFQEDVFRFDESAIRDVVDWLWNRGLQNDLVSTGFEALEFVLGRVFAIEQFSIFEADWHKKRLIRNDFFPGRREDGDGMTSISLEDPGSQHVREVRVFRSGLYTVEVEEGNHLKVVIPLRDHAYRVSGVVSFWTKRYMESWSTLFVRIPVIERAVNLVWPKLSRYESDQHKVFKSLAKSVVAETNSSKRGIPILIATKFGTDLHRHFKRNLERFPDAFSASILEFKKGVVFEKILDAIRSRNSFLIFDLSKINNNVLFELGVAIGLNRPGLPVYEEGYRSEQDLLGGLVYATYRNKRPLGEEFFDLLHERWSGYQTRHSEPDFIHLLDHRLPAEEPSESSKPYLVVVDHNYFRDCHLYRKAVEKVAKSHGLDVVYLWRPDDQFGTNLTSRDNLVLVQMLRLIRSAYCVVARVEKIERDRSSASRFVAVGISKGLESLTGIKNVILTARGESKEGDEVVVPSDLSGVGRLRFGERNKLFEGQLLDFLRNLA